MKNFKIILSTIIFYYLYGLFTFLFSFVVTAYVQDIFNDFKRFKLITSFGDNLYAVGVLIIWIFFTIFIIKYNKMIYLKLFDKEQGVVQENIAVTPCFSYYLKTTQQEFSWNNYHGKISTKFE